MKQASTTILFTLLLITGQGQKANFKIRSQILPVSLVFLAGVSDGFTETISHNYKGFKNVFPKANDRIFDPGLSYVRKYRNGDREQGARFPGSKTYLVWTTDAYHASRFAQHLFLAGAFALKITEGKQRWWVYLAQGLGYWLVNRAAFAMTFNYFQSKR